MATKRQFLVQFVMPWGPIGSQVGLLLEQLRYAGLLVYTDAAGIDELGGPRSPKSYTVALTPPKGVDQVAWCGMNVDRMRSFGIKADVVTK